MEASKSNFRVPLWQVVTAPDLTPTEWVRCSKCGHLENWTLRPKEGGVFLGLESCPECENANVVPVELPA